MRWPIRNQILVPFAALQIIAVTAISIGTAVLAMARADRDAELRLQQVIQVLRASNFPYTESVLDKMRGLSGAEFVAVNDATSVQATTMDDADLGILADAPMIANEAFSLDDLHSVQIVDRSYLAARTVAHGPNGAVQLYVLYPETARDAARREALWPPIGIGAITLLAMIAASAWLAGRLGKRMRTIQNQVARIASGDFQDVESGPRNDEINDLAESVNQMCEDLRSMETAIREQERAELVTQLAGGLAHQLRNAITGARLAVQLHKKRCPDGERESLEIALKQLTLTEEQIKGLLRLTSDHRQPVRPGAFDDAIDDVCTMVVPVCAHRNVRFQRSVDATQSQVADVEGVRAALLNLLLNGIEAAGPGGNVELHVRLEPPYAHIHVSDDGPGVADEVAASLFVPFVTTKTEGVGLGLALAQQAAKEQGGSLAHERAHDRTTFRLTIQVAACEPSQVSEATRRRTVQLQESTS